MRFPKFWKKKSKSVSPLDSFLAYGQEVPHDMSFCKVTGLTWSPDLEREALGADPLGVSEVHSKYAQKALDQPSLSSRVMANIISARESGDEYKLPYGYAIVQMGLAVDDFYIEKYI